MHIDVFDCVLLLKSSKETVHKRKQSKKRKREKNSFSLARNLKDSIKLLQRTWVTIYLNHEIYKTTKTSSGIKIKN